MTASKRTDLPTAWDDRATLLQMLVYTRDTAMWKCEGLSDEQARRALLPTSPLMTVVGIVNHLRWVEYSWIEGDMLGREEVYPWPEDAPTKEMSYALGVPLAEVIAGWREQIARYDELFADLDLDLRAAKPVSTGEKPTFRWILHHLVEENARHNGHLDIIREMLDGTTGD
ncbi:MAG: hypothetical protein QOE01_1506 [Actinomycetota bacterium]|nr:hypothetical protein [Actinomycetota bacterium]